MSAFETSRILRFGQCDPSGIAYFPAYLDMLVGVTEDLFAAIGWPWPKLRSERAITTPTVSLDVTFSRPGMEGDRLSFRCAVSRIGTTSLDLSHTVSAQRELWRAGQRLVATSPQTHRPVPWPDDIRTGLSQFQESDDA
ncbi:acyl-CoA thioesterase [Qipengyuania nanhaisediminis]|uniref:acyl-CoA thioesterase n=1 Tax=Qipengyuania nanhaisediminis TaxID=604088 RepID=UPI0038B3CEC8